MRYTLFSIIFFICQLATFGQNFAKGNEAYFKDDNIKAIEFFTLAIENSEEVSKAYMYRGGAYMFLDRYDEALKDLNASKKLDSSNSKLYFYFGKLYIRQLDF